MFRLFMMFLIVFIASCSENPTSPEGVLTVDDTLNSKVDSTDSIQGSEISKRKLSYAILSDYKIGVLSKISFDTVLSISEFNIALGGDAVVEEANNCLYVLNRSYTSKATIFKINGNNILEKSISFQNPHSIAILNDSIAYLTLYNVGKILKINANTLDSLKVIDLPFPADSSNPAPDAISIIDNKVYITLQFLKNYSPSRNGQILVLDPKTDVIEDSINLPFTNPVTNILQIDDNIIAVGCVGNYFVEGDGGISFIDLSKKIVVDSIANIDPVVRLSKDVNNRLYFLDGDYGYYKLKFYESSTQQIKDVLTNYAKSMLDFDIIDSLAFVGVASYDATQYTYLTPQLLALNLNQQIIVDSIKIDMPVYNFKH